MVAFGQSSSLKDNGVWSILVDQEDLDVFKGPDRFDPMGAVVHGIDLNVRFVTVSVRRKILLNPKPRLVSPDIVP